MATQILIKRSSTGGGVPTTSDITAGEFAVNLVDRKLYTNNGTAVIRLDSAYVDSTAPANGVEGDLWYDTANNLLKTHNGTGFVAAGYTSLTQFGVTATAAELNLLDGVTATTAELNLLDGVTATTAEINYIDGVTSNIQTQLNGKSATTHNHTLDSLSNTTITSNTSGEILKWNGTAWVNNTLAEAGIQPSGAYLTSESDTLATVTSRGATSSNAISLTNATASSSTGTGALTVTGGVGIGGALNVGGNTIITGNLTVNGTTTTVNSNTVNIGDNILVLNSDETGTPSQNGGIEIERGTSVNVSFLWDEASDYWTLGDKQLAGVTLDGGSY
jgi:hypothetical protein